MSNTVLRDRALYTPQQLAPLISPRTVAVVGASGRPGFATNVLRHLQEAQFGERLFVVNPNYEEVMGVRTVPTLGDLETELDLAVLGVGGAKAVDIVREAGQAGVKAVLIHASGFAEGGGAKGMALQDELVELAEKYGIRICGPNVLGLMNFKEGICLGGQLFPGRRPGNIGIVSQSGGLGLYLTQVPAKDAILFSHCLCAGNGVDVQTFDFANYLLADDSTKVVAMAIEGVPSIGRMLELGDNARAAGKPIIVYKAGKTERGARAALSHTGSIAGSYVVCQAAFREAGLVEVRSYDDLVETAAWFAKAKPPTGRGAAVITGMGGVAVMACDWADAAGVDLPTPSEHTLDTLRATVPDYGTFHNPIDLTANPGGPDKFETALRLVADDPNFDVVVMPLAPSPSLAEDRPSAVCRVAAASNATVCVYWTSQWLEGPGTEVLAADPNVPMFRSLERLFATIKRWEWWHTTLGRPARSQVPDALDQGQRDEVHAVLDRYANAGLRTLGEATAREVAAAAGLPIAHGRLVHSASDARAAAEDIGYPVVLKALSPDVLHKTEAGVVRLAVKDGPAVMTAFDEVKAALDAYRPGAALDGVLVGEMARGRTEMIVGARRDPVFGPVVVCGMGGVAVELFGPPAVALCPIDHAGAHEMITGLPGAASLGAHRGQPAADLAALADVVARVSALMVAEPRIMEIDLNPVLIRDERAHSTGDEGAGAVILDALIVLDAADSATA